MPRLRCALLLASLATASPALPGSWLQFGGSASRASATQLLGPSTGASSVAWTASVGAARLGGPASFASADANASTLYVGNADGVVAALATATGAERWAVTIAGADFARSTPAVSDALVVLCTRRARAPAAAVVALNASSGALVWELVVAGSDNNVVGGAPLMLPGGDVVVLDLNDVLYRLGAATGSVVWATMVRPFIAPDYAGQTLALAQSAAHGPLVLLFFACTVSALSAADGAFAWNTSFPCKSPAQEPVGALAVAPGGLVIVGTTPSIVANAVQPSLRALNPTTGAVLWQTFANASFSDRPVSFSPDGARIYTLDKNAPGAAASEFFLVALETATGAPLWSVGVSVLTDNRPLAVGGDDIVYSVAGDEPATALGHFGSNGSVAWLHTDNVEGPSWQVAIAGAGQLVWGTLGGTVVLVRADTLPQSMTPSPPPTPSGTPSPPPTPSGTPSPPPTPSASPSVGASPSPSPVPRAASRTESPSPSRAAEGAALAAPADSVPAIAATSAVAALVLLGCGLRAARRAAGRAMPAALYKTAVSNDGDDGHWGAAFANPVGVAAARGAVAVAAASPVSAVNVEGATAPRAPPVAASSWAAPRAPPAARSAPVADDPVAIDDAEPDAPTSEGVGAHAGLVGAGTVDAGAVGAEKSSVHFDISDFRGAPGVSSTGADETDKARLYLG